MPLTEHPGTKAFDDLVQLAIALRPSWQSPGVKAAIRKAILRDPDFTFADLCFAVASVASDKTQKTPAPIAFDGPWWQRTPEATTPAGTPWEDRCSTCSYPKHVCDRDADHVFIPNRAKRPGVAAPDELDQTMRQALAQMRGGRCSLHHANPCRMCDQAKQDADEETSA